VVDADGERLGVAILGAGFVAGKYLDALRGEPRCEVVGIFSPTPGRAASLAEAHGSRARAYASVDELFADERVQIVVSATPPSVRPEHVVRAAESGRHVVIEKPLATSFAAVEQMRAAVARAGVRTVTSFVLRWNPQIRTIRRLVDDGTIGELLYAEGDYWHPLPGFYHDSWLFTRREGGSAFVGAGCHAADAIRYLAGEVVEVAALSAPPRILRTLEYDPVVTASLRFANGAVGKLSTVLEGDTPHVFNTRLFGTDGTIQNDRVFSSARFPGATGYVRVPTVPPDTPAGQHPFAAEIAHLLDCIEAGVESHASIHDTWRSMALCFAIDESAAAGGEPVRVRGAVEG
jgi:predicted dehydrogenase